MTTEFVTQSGLVARQSWSGNTIDFFYDAQQRPYAMIYKPAGGTSATYYYLTDLQGDVIALLDESGSVVAEYEYGAWGDIRRITDSSGAQVTSSAHIASINPLRYRGYYYDTETGFYYLQSRYYDPVIKRFINADGYVTTGRGITDYNMFSYCGNNPVNRSDSNGALWKEIGNWLKKAWTNVTIWASSTFGAGSSIFATIAKTEIEYIPDPLPITAKTGTKTVQTVSKQGDSSKPVSVYAKQDIEHPIQSSSAGVKLNISRFALNISLGLDNMGIFGSIVDGNTTNSFGIKANISELKVGVEYSTAIK